MSKKEETSFEKAFARLEEILEIMNAGNVSLDESLKLYEEADKLIRTCGKRLNEAERKVQMLIKNRAGELETDQSNEPKTEDFNLSNG